MLATARSRVDTTQSKQLASRSASRQKCHNSSSAKRRLLSAGKKPNDQRETWIVTVYRERHTPRAREFSLLYEKPTRLVWLATISTGPGTRTKMDTINRLLKTVSPKGKPKI